MADLGKGVQVVLDLLRENAGDFLIEAESAEAIFNGTKDVKVKDLSDRQLLQYALILSMNEREMLIKQLSEMNTAPALNREARRALANGKR